MKFVHVKNLDKYHPGYQDRYLIWCKLHFSMLGGDPLFEMLCEIDQWRFVKLIMLELQSRGPVPLDQKYLERKGFDFKKRSMSLTLQDLHEFIEVRNTNDKDGVTPTDEVVATSTSISISLLKRSDVPKSIDEAIEYFLEIGSTKIAATRFFDYFTSIGWMVGKSHRMKDWKAAARNWVNRDKENPHKGSALPVKKTVDTGASKEQIEKWKSEAATEMPDECREQLARFGIRSRK